MMYFEEVDKAINFAAATAPACVGYRCGNGWFTYKPTEGCPRDSVPEFFVAKQGTHPLPLSETAQKVWMSLLEAKLAA